MRTKKVKGYICATEWEYEFGEGACGPSRIYDSLKECREKCKCCKGCGIIELEIKSLGYAQKPDRKWDVSNSIKISGGDKNVKDNKDG